MSKTLEIEEREKEMEHIYRMPWHSDWGNKAEVKFPGAGNVYRLPAHLRKELSMPFPAEAITSYQGKGTGKLSTIKAAFIFERLDSVFGIMGWVPESEVVGIYDVPERDPGKKLLNEDGSPVLNNWGKPVYDKKGEIVYTYRHLVVRSRIYIRQFDLYTGYAFGGCELDDYGSGFSDGFKKAQTDSLTKCAGNFLEIGIQVFKGQPDSQVPNTIAKFTKEEEERLKNEYLESRKLAPSKQAPEEAKQSQSDRPGDQEEKKPVNFEEERQKSGVGLAKRDEPIDYDKIIETVKMTPSIDKVKMLLKDVGIEIPSEEFKTLTGRSRMTQAGIVEFLQVNYLGMTAEKDNQPEETGPGNDEESQQAEDTENIANVKVSEFESSGDLEDDDLPLDDEFSEDEELSMVKDILKDHIQRGALNAFLQENLEPMRARFKEETVSGVLNQHALLVNLMRDMRSVTSKETMNTWINGPLLTMVKGIDKDYHESIKVLVKRYQAKNIK